MFCHRFSMFYLFNKLADDYIVRWMIVFFLARKLMVSHWFSLIEINWQPQGDHEFCRWFHDISKCKRKKRLKRISSGKSKICIDRFLLLSFVLSSSKSRSVEMEKKRTVNVFNNEENIRLNFFCVYCLVDKRTHTSVILIKFIRQHIVETNLSRKVIWKILLLPGILCARFPY